MGVWMVVEVEVEVGVVVRCGGCLPTAPSRALTSAVEATWLHSSFSSSGCPAILPHPSTQAGAGELHQRTRRELEPRPRARALPGLEADAAAQRLAGCAPALGARHQKLETIERARLSR